MSDAFTWEIGLAYKPLLNGAGCEQDGLFAAARASPDADAGHDAPAAAGDQDAAAFEPRADAVHRCGDPAEPVARTPRATARTASPCSPRRSPRGPRAALSRVDGRPISSPT